jgi:hypothetical protein
MKKFLKIKRKADSLKLKDLNNKYLNSLTKELMEKFIKELIL